MIYIILQLSRGSLRASAQRLASKCSLSKTAGCTEKLSCLDCRKKRAQIKAIKTKVIRLEREAAELKTEKEHNQETVDMKVKINVAGILVAKNIAIFLLI